MYRMDKLESTTDANGETKTKIVEEGGFPKDMDEELMFTLEEKLPKELYRCIYNTACASDYKEVLIMIKETIPVIK